MLDDDDFTPDSEDLFGLIEYELHEPCILAGPRSQNHGATRRFDGRQIHRTPLGLRDDLLCDDDDVSGGQSKSLALQRIGKQRRSTIAPLHERPRLQSSQRE